MQKLHCDRCGQEMKNNHATVSIDEHRGVTTVKGRPTDLCISCMHELQQFLKGRQSDKGRIL